jgi:hypothetical protein
MTSLWSFGARPTKPKVRWQHLLFVKGNYVLSCDVDSRANGTYVASLFPLWAQEDMVTETFTDPADALRWHVQTARTLQADGWIVYRAGVVTNAA